MLADWRTMRRRKTCNIRALTIAKENSRKQGSRHANVKGSNILNNCWLVFDKIVPNILESQLPRAAQILGLQHPCPEIQEESPIWHYLNDMTDMSDMADMTK
jgi:hypothetical protein